MNEDFAIVILTQNNSECIIKTINTLREYADKHPTLRQIIIADDASKDGTTELVMKWISNNKDDRYGLITHQEKIGEKKLLITSLEQVKTGITVLLDVKLHTKLHQIRLQKKLLHKAHLIIPNRFHRLSRTNYKPDMIKKINRLIKKDEYEDTENPQKSFRTKNILEALKKDKNKKLDWKKIIKENTKIKVTICQTHYIIKTNTK